MTGADKIARSGIVIGKRAAGRGALFGGNAGGCAMPVVNRDCEGGAVRRIVMRHHRIQPQAARLLGRDRRANDAAGMADDEGHFLRRAKRCCNNQVALAFAVVIIGHNQNFTAGESCYCFLDFRNGGVFIPCGEAKEVIRRHRSMGDLGYFLGSFA